MTTEKEITKALLTKTAPTLRVVCWKNHEDGFKSIIHIFQFVNNADSRIAKGSKFSCSIRWAIQEAVDVMKKVPGSYAAIEEITE